MSRDDILERLNDIFIEIFDDEGIKITDETTMDDIDGWDSLTHIAIVAEAESTFNIKFSMQDIMGVKKVGDIADVIERAIV